MEAGQMREELTRRLHQEPPAPDPQTAEEAATVAKAMVPATDEGPEARESAA
jgi:hypothetical protein